MKPHKHAELIKAWADGATIEVLSDNEWYTLYITPCWAENSIYRIKPEPVYRELVEGEIIQEGDELLYHGTYFPYVGYVGHRYTGCYSEQTRTTRPAPAPAPKPEVKPDWVISVNLNLTIDGTTNQLKSAEVIK